MQLVIHSPYGSRLNRAWGLSLRKRFCRQFNFELQAAATEDAIVLSLTGAHSFALEDVTRYLNAKTVRPLLVQAMLDAPMFAARWRWAASISLALPRFRSGKKVAPQILRMQAEDLIAAVFPDQIACFENLAGEREVPDHPLVNQAVHDCLHEAMDIEGLERLLRRLETGEVRAICRDLNAPSPLALEALSAKPYAFLDDAPLEERRTQAVMARRWLDPKAASDLGRLDPEAIAAVRAEAWPDPADAEEMHDALLWLGFVTEAEARADADWRQWLDSFGRRRSRDPPSGAGRRGLGRGGAAGQFRALWPEARLAPESTRRRTIGKAGRRGGAGRDPARPARGARPGHPDGARRLARPRAGADRRGARRARSRRRDLAGRLRPGVNDEQWCDRRLLARIHRRTVNRLRAEIEPVAARDFLRFLFSWQHVDRGYAARRAGRPAASLSPSSKGTRRRRGPGRRRSCPARLKNYRALWLDAAMLRPGRIAWTRLSPAPASNERARSAPVRATPIALSSAAASRLWTSLAPVAATPAIGGKAEAVLDALTAATAPSSSTNSSTRRGCCAPRSRQALGELVALGLVASDGFAGLRALLDAVKPAQAASAARGGAARSCHSTSKAAAAGR